MADTGAPWNIPYVEPTDLVREYPAADEAQANAIAAGLNAAGGLVAVKSAIFTGIQSDAVTAGGNVAVTDLSITHEVADAANKLIIIAGLGFASAVGQRNSVGVGVHDGTGLIGAGTAAGSRTVVSTGGRTTNSGGPETGTMPYAVIIHTPGTGSKTYTVRAILTEQGAQTIHINRSNADTDNADHVRAASVLYVLEVKV